MTQKQFFDILFRTKGWELVGDWGILRKKSNNKLVCPICAVANHLLKKNKYYTDSYDAGQYLNLTLVFSTDISMAADNICLSRTQRLRNKLLKGLKLKEYSFEEIAISDSTT